MSAYIVSDEHIHALVNYAVREQVDYYADQTRVRINAESASEIGQLLLDENYRSVHHRYAERTEGYFGKPGSSYKFKPTRVIPDAITILKLIDCLDYQSCENDDWEQSIAFKILAQVKNRAIRRLPGYDDAPWGI